MIVCNCDYCKELKPKQPRTYEQGFRDGMSMDHKMPMTFQFMGYSMEQIIELITKHEEQEFYSNPQWSEADIEKMKVKQPRSIVDKLKERQEQTNKEARMSTNEKYKWAKLDSGSDREFLEWLWQRLHSVFGEPANCTHMQRLDKVIQETNGASSVDKPAFEIKSDIRGIDIKVWADGRTEGVTGTFVNRIPQLIAEAKQK